MRSRRAPPTSAARGRASAGLVLETAGRSRGPPRSQSRASMTSRGRSARPSPRVARAPPGPKSTSASRRADVGRSTGEGRARRPLEQRLGDAKRARGARSPPTRRPSPLPLGSSPGREPRGRSTASARRCASSRLRSWDRRPRERRACSPCRAIEVPSAVKYSPDREVERAAVREVDHLLEGALAEGAGADHRRQLVLGRAPRSGSRPRRRCRGRSARRSACAARSCPGRR